VTLDASADGVACFGAGLTFAACAVGCAAGFAAALAMEFSAVGCFRDVEQPLNDATTSAATKK
jgi:hypothetical protein